MHQSCSDIDPAFHPTRKFINHLVGTLSEGNDVQDIIDAFLELATAQSIDTPEEAQVSTCAEGGIKSQILRHQAVNFLDLI